MLILNKSQCQPVRNGKNPEGSSPLLQKLRCRTSSWGLDDCLVTFSTFLHSLAQSAYIIQRQVLMYKRVDWDMLYLLVDPYGFEDFIQSRGMDIFQKNIARLTKSITEVNTSHWKCITVCDSLVWEIPELLIGGKDYSDCTCCNHHIRKILTSDQSIWLTFTDIMVDTVWLDPQ